MANDDKINIRAVAEHAGVSVATVSRALNKKTCVSKKTRDKIFRACGALNYHLNPSIQDLVLKSRNGVTRNIAFVLVGLEFADPAYARLLDFIAKEVNQAHYQLHLVKLSGQESSRYELPPTLRDLRVDGILLTGDITTPIMTLIQEMGIECVVIGNYSDELLAACSSAKVNFRQAVTKGIRLLMEQGCCRVAFADENPQLFSVRECYEAFQHSLSNYGLTFDSKLIYWGNGNLTGISNVLEPVFMEPQLPFDAIFCYDYRQAVEISWLAMARYGRTGKYDARICTVRNFGYYKLPIPAVYVDINLEGEVNAAFRQLIGRLEDKVECQTILVNSK